MNLSAKLTLPMALPIVGMMMSLTMDVTILPNAAPIMIPTAMSTTLPRIANSLNSLTMPMTLLLSRGWLGPRLLAEHAADGVRGALRRPGSGGAGHGLF